MPNHFYAFLYHNEAPDRDAPESLLRFEVLEADWFRRVWDELGDEDLRVQLPRVPGSRFAGEYTGLGSALRRTLYDLHDRYAERAFAWNDPAPVGLLEALVSDDILPRDRITEGDWYEVRLTDGEPMNEDALRNPEEVSEAILSMLGRTADEDDPPRLCRIDSFGTSGGVETDSLLPVLAALHFPQTLLEDEDDGGEPEPRGQTRFDPGGGAEDSGGLLVTRPAGPRDPGGGAGERRPEVFDDADFRDCGNTPCTCRWTSVGACIPVWRRYRWAPVEREVAVTPPTPATRVYQYRYPAQANTQPQVQQVRAMGQGGGSADTSSGSEAAGSAQTREGTGCRGGVHGMEQVAAEAQAIAAPPPPVPASIGYQMFVGVNLVGAGNNVALWDNGANLSAYVDYGWPVRPNANTYPVGEPLPCVCTDPLMVLTHWDYDHYAMVRKVPDALRRRWIAPRQVMGPTAHRVLYQPLRKGVGTGARLLLWKTTGGHVVAPFGVLVRADGPPVNEDCIVAYVQVDGAAPGPHSPDVSPQLARRDATLPRIADDGLPGEWFHTAPEAPFEAGEVVVPSAAAGSFRQPPYPAAAGEVQEIQDARGNWATAKWIPPEGVPLAGGGTFYPSGGMGGWAISARDFVLQGGRLVDHPDLDTGFEGARVLSPTPRTDWEWVWDAPEIVPAEGLVRSDDTRWVPVWGTDLGPSRMEPLARSAERLRVSRDEPPLDGEDARYVLLPGDAGCNHISPQRRAGAGRQVVGIVATHHGSATWLTRTASAPAPELAYVPAAPSALGCEQIVYSYGTQLRGRNAGKHCYRLASGEGHPHKEAVDGFKGRGWGVSRPTPGSPFARLNTAPEDYRSAQPCNPLSIASHHALAAVYALGHRSGNVALGWDAAGGPLRRDHGPAGFVGAPAPAPGVLPPLRRTCHVCRQQRDYYF